MKRELIRLITPYDIGNRICHCIVPKVIRCLLITIMFIFHLMYKLIFIIKQDVVFERILDSNIVLS